MSNQRKSIYKGTHCVIFDEYGHVEVVIRLANVKKKARFRFNPRCTIYKVGTNQSYKNSKQIG